MTFPPVRKRPRYIPHAHSDERGNLDAFERDELPDDESDQDWVAHESLSGDQGEGGTDDGSDSATDDGDEYVENDHVDDEKTAGLLDLSSAGNATAQQPGPNCSVASRLNSSGLLLEQPSLMAPGTRDVVGARSVKIGAAARQPTWPENFELDEIETSSDDNYDDDLEGEGAESDDDDDEDDYESDADGFDESESDAGDRTGRPNSLSSTDRRAPGKASRGRAESPVGGRDYAQFLATILAEDSPPMASVPGSFSALLDDDFDADFDYLTAAAQTTEDPQEFRNDKAVHVSRREIVQLVSGRPARRRRHRNIMPAAPSRSMPAGSFPNPQSSNGAFTPHCLNPAFGTAPRIQQPALLQPRPAQGVIPIIHPWLGNADEVISEMTSARIREQLNIHVLLLAHVHAASHDAKAKTDTASLLREILEMRDLSQRYKAMFEPHRRDHEDTLHARVGRDLAPPETCFAIPALDVAAEFLADSYAGVSNANQSLERFRPFGDESVHRALAARITDSALLSDSEPGPPWTVEDDCLLAMTVAKHTIDFGDESKDLLPHRETRDCERRMRFLSSRRCGENPVKRQVHLVTLNQTPLSKDEIEIVKAGLLRYGNGFERDESRRRDLWKLVQRDFLPHRDWRHLERTWGWREARRAYKQRSLQKSKKF
jgi:hypothetical protein